MTASADRSGQRLKAWARLFAAGLQRLPLPDLLITTDSQAMDRLLEEAERLGQERRDPVFKIDLPCLRGKAASFTEQLSCFQRKTNSLGIEEILSENTSFPDSEALSAWNAAMDECFPAENYGRIQLALYRLSDVRLCHLLLDSFGSRDDAEILLKDEEHPRTGWFGLLRQTGCQ